MTQPAATAESSKAALKAQRREKQEAQRAAKASSAPTKAAPNKASSSSKSATAPVKEAPAAPSNNAASSSNTPAQLNASLFMHLDQPGKAAKPKSEKDVHPSIKRLALLWSELQIVGCNARCLSMLTAFKDVRSETIYLEPLLTSGSTGHTVLYGSSWCGIVKTPPATSLASNRASLQGEVTLIDAGQRHPLYQVGNSANPNGYGRRRGKGRAVRAHRFLHAGSHHFCRQSHRSEYYCQDPRRRRRPDLCEVRKCFLEGLSSS
jgi:hypothetical protein